MMELLERIDRVTLEANKHFANLTAQQLNYKTGEQWSIAQNLDHLIIVNESYKPVIDSARNNSLNTGWMGKVGFIVRFWGRKIHESVEPLTKKKIKTLKGWEPHETYYIYGIIARFNAHQDWLKQLITDSQAMVKSNAIIHSPASKMIVYTMEDAFRILVTHEERHLNQAKDVLFAQLSERIAM